MNAIGLIVLLLISAVLLPSTAHVHAAVAYLNGTAGTSATLEGIVADRACVDIGVGFDAADMKRSPQDHTLFCMLLTTCINSGYCLLQQDTTTKQWACAYNFTSAATVSIVTGLTQLHSKIPGASGSQDSLKSTKNLYVALKGKWETPSTFVPDAVASGGVEWSPKRGAAGVVGSRWLIASVACLLAWCVAVATL